MKKIISLLIIATMFIFVLASCNKNSNGNNNVRTKITEEEWNAFDNITNYTCNIKGTSYEFAFGTYHGSGYTATIKTAENIEHSFYKFGHESDAQTLEYYYFIENGESYRLSVSSNGDCTAKASKVTPDSLLEYISFDEIEFDDLTYNVKDKTYTASIVDEYGTITLTYHFKNGSLSQFEVKNSDPDDKYNETVTFSNIGTTTVTLPEYTFKD